jgi:cellulose synthase/poly-beta-1,6-N-acetylglucosamine synthase-like glycosyltransferase
MVHGQLGIAGMVLAIYFVCLNGGYTVLLVAGWLEINGYVSRRPLRDYDAVADSLLTRPISLVVPAHNEELSIVESVKSLLATRYATFEVLVVNDGSGDSTLERLIEAFDLRPVERVPRSEIASAAVRSVYASPVEPRLIVVDKENGGGKADALNAGLRYARFPLFCAIDADTILDQDALSRLVYPFQADASTIACGGIVRIVNGSRVANGAVVDVRAPRSMLVNLQILEYLRAFLCGRTGWSRMKMLLIISGAFGLFDREVVIAAGGYSLATITEDAELVVRLHRHCLEEGRPYKMAFLADPVCWTEAPRELAGLTRQRDRWQRGLVQTLVMHRGMIGRRRYGRIGLVAMPYLLVFEVLGPFVELLALAWLLTAFVVLQSTTVPFELVVGSIAYGLVLSLGAVVIEERAFRRYHRWRDLARIVLAAVIENFGYRQWQMLLRVRGVLRFRMDVGWGTIPRTGFDTLPAPLAAPQTAKAA